MAESECDILIVRDRDMSSVPDTTDSPFRGVPEYDLEYAIVDPKRTFESPQEVANVTDISVDLRRRILQVWEYDISAEMSEENEGGPVQGVDVNMLDKILSAKAHLDMQQERSADKSTRLSGAS